MGSLSIYLLKSVVWLIGFAIVFLIFLRNERYFVLNRIYLLSGIIASIAFPFCTWYYTVLIPIEQTSANTILDLSTTVGTNQIPENHIIWYLYVAGIGLLAIRLIWQTVKIIQKLRHTGYESNGSEKLVRTNDYTASFSFFSYIFVNPSISDIEVKEILNHEREHIKQKHWFDLLLTEVLCMLQWFNPFVWIYAHLIRQNHEFLADESALQHSSSPAHYKAILLNQLVGDPLIRLAILLIISLNKKRFKMMKESRRSLFRKIKLLIIFPIMALVFYAFAEPDFKVSTSSITLSETANSGNGQKDKNSSSAIEPISVKTVTDTVKHLSVIESKKNFRNRTLSAADTMQRISEKSQQKSLPINITAADSAILRNAQNLNVKIGFPAAVLHLKSPKTFVGFQTALGHPIDPIVFPNNKHIYFAYMSKDLTLGHDISGNALLQSIGVSHIKLVFPKKPFGMIRGYPSNITVMDSIINRH